MARVTGLGSFLVVGVFVLVGLRLLHVGVPVIFPETHPGPFHPESLDEAAGLVDFVPLVPSYRPEVLGEGPVALTVVRAPEPRVEIAWRGERFLTLRERRGQAPEPPPGASGLAGFEDSWQWVEGETHHAIVRRGDVWVRIETDLPERDLRRLADTLGPWSPGLRRPRPR